MSCGLRQADVEDLGSIGGRPAPVPCLRGVVRGALIADFDAVYGIGATLAPRLWANQPFNSIADLEAVHGMGPVRANAVWSHFCR